MSPETLQPPQRCSRCFLFREKLLPRETDAAGAYSWAVASTNATHISSTRAENKRRRVGRVVAAARRTADVYTLSRRSPRPGRGRCSPVVVPLATRLLLAVLLCSAWPLTGPFDCGQSVGRSSCCCCWGGGGCSCRSGHVADLRRVSTLSCRQRRLHDVDGRSASGNVRPLCARWVNPRLRCQIVACSIVFSVD